MDGFIPLSVGDLDTPNGISRLNAMLQGLFLNAPGDRTGISDFMGYGSPEGVLAASIGSTYRRVDGGTSTTLYIKQSGTTNTGWVPTGGLPTFPLSTANGGTGADFSAAAQGTIFYVSATGVISALAPGTSGFLLKTQGAAANPAWTAPANFSNIVFKYQAVVNNAGGDFGEVINVATLINTATVTGYRYLRGDQGGSDSAVLTGKYNKLSGVNTVTVNAELWLNSNAGSDVPRIGIVIGSLAKVYVTSNSTSIVAPGTWFSNTIDVSSLTNGTTYDITIYTSKGSGSNTTRPYCGTIIAFGS